MTLPQAALEISAKFRAIVEELNLEFFERRDHTEALTDALLAKEHTFLLGRPGTAKSLLIRALCGRIVGARYWEALLDRQLPMENMFGPLDILRFRETGEWVRKTDGYLPSAHMVLLDEVGKAGPATTNPMLTAVNERLFHNGPTPMHIPLISCAGASNEELEFPEQAALWDRFMVRLIVESIQEPGNFAALLQTAVHSDADVPTEVTLDELMAAVDKWVPSVTLPPGVVDSIMQLRSDLRAEQITPSDRRWKKSVRLLQASAFRAGRSAVDDDDLGILRHVLWDVVEQIPMVEKKVLSLAGELTRLAMEIEDKISDIDAGIDERKGQSVDTRSGYGGEANNKIQAIQRQLTDAIEKARRQGRSAARLEQAEGHAKATRVRILVECLNMPQDRAEINLNKGN